VRWHRLWWDDAWAFFSMLNIMCLIGVTFTHFASPPSETTRVAAYYLSTVFFTTVVWTARLSILFSVIRITPTPYMKKVLSYIAVLFVVFWLVLLVQPFWVCEAEPGWKEEPNPQCALGEQVAILQICTDVIADILLIAAPCWDLRNVMDKGLRRRLMILFSTSIMTTIVSLVHDGIVLTQGGIREALAALLEDSIGLIVANLAVVVTAVYRLFTKNEDVVKSRSSGTRTIGSASISIKFPKNKKQTNTFATTYNTTTFTVADDIPYKGDTTINESRIDDRTLNDSKQVGLVSDSYEMTRTMA